MGFPRSASPVKPFDSAILVSLAAVGAVAVVFALGGLFLFGAAVGLGVAVGGLVATLNLWFFAYVGRGVLSGGPRSRYWAMIAVLKILLLFGGAWLLMKSGLTSPLTLALGYGSLPLGITIGSFLRSGYDVELPAESDAHALAKLAGVPAGKLLIGTPETEREPE